MVRSTGKKTLAVLRRGAAKVYDTEAQRLINGELFNLPNDERLNVRTMCAELRDYLLRTMFLTPGSMESLTHNETRNSILRDMNEDPTQLIDKLKAAVKDCEKEKSTAQREFDKTIDAEDNAKENIKRISLTDASLLQTGINHRLNEIQNICGTNHSEEDSCCDLAERLGAARKSRDEVQSAFDRTSRELTNVKKLPQSNKDDGKPVDELNSLIAKKEREQSKLEGHLECLIDGEHSEKNCSRCLAPINVVNIQRQRAEWTMNLSRLKQEIDALQRQRNYLEFRRVSTDHNEKQQQLLNSKSAVEELNIKNQQHNALLKTLRSLQQELFTHKAIESNAQAELKSRSDARNKAQRNSESVERNFVAVQRALESVSSCAEKSWVSVLLGIQRRCQQWLDHLFRPFSFRADGELVRHGTQLTLRFQSTTKPYRLLSDSLVENYDESSWEPVVELLTNNSETNNNGDDDNHTLEESKKIYALSALSFSEFERVRLALFFACAEQIMYRRQVFTNIFVLDECFAGVDTFGILLMLITLRMWATSINADNLHSSTSEAERRRSQFWHRSLFLSSALNLHHLFGFQFDSMVLIDKRGSRHQEL